LFGIATIVDVHQLHKTLDNLQPRNFDILHSLADQVTCILKLNSIININTDAIVNLSAVVRDAMVQSHEKYKQITRDIMWLNITVFNQSELYMAVRQLEFSLLLLIQQIDELFAAVQSLLQVRQPMSVVNPTTLHGILRNVSLNLPENYELILGTNQEDIHLHCELVKVAIVGTVHGIRLLMIIPLKTAD